MTRSHSLLALASLCLAACAAFVVDVGRTLAAAPVEAFHLFERGVALAWSWLAPVEEPELRLEPWVDEYSAVGDPIDPAVLNSLRHEAGMRPLRC